MNLDNNFIKKFGANLTSNVDLSKYNWFSLGGEAEFFFKPVDKIQLIEFLTEAKKKKFEHYNFRCRFQYII